MEKKRIPGVERRGLIIEAALEVFAERGYEGATVQRIADRAKINNGLIYKHFAGKADLYKAVLKKAPFQMFSEEEAQKLFKGNNDREVLKAFARRYLEIMKSNEKFVKFLNLGQWEKPQVFEMQYFHSQEFPITMLANYLEQRMKEKKLRKKKPRLAARVFLSTIHWYGLRLIIAKLHNYPAKGWAHTDEKEVLDIIVDVYLEGMKPRKRLPKKK